MFALAKSIRSAMHVQYKCPRTVPTSWNTLKLIVPVQSIQGNVVMLFSRGTTTLDKGQALPSYLHIP